MDSLIQKLGIDWKLLIAQIINFLVLLAILYKFLYKPLLNMMQKRTKTIEDSLKNAERIEQNLTHSLAEKEKMLTGARIAAQEVLRGAKEQSQAIKNEMLKEAKNEINKLTIEAQKEIENKKQAAIREAKSGVAELVMAAVRKIIGDNLDEKLDQKFIEKRLEQAE